MISFEDIDKGKIAAVAGVALGAAALVLALGVKSKINTINASLDFDKTVNVEVSGPEGAETVEETSDIIYYTETEVSEMSESDIEAVYAMVEAGTAAIVTDEEAAAAESSGTASFNLIIQDGSLKIVDSTLKLSYSDDTDGIYEDIYIYLEGENAVEYDSSQNYLVVNDTMIVKTISAVDATYSGIAEFTNSEGEYVLIGERQVTDNVALAVVNTIGSSGMGITDDDIYEVQSILNGASSTNEIKQFTLFGVLGNIDWIEDIIMTNRAIELIKGDTEIYISPYTGSFAEGTTNSLPIGSITLDYCESAQDTSTGYIPYIYEFAGNQGGYAASGSSDTTLKAKILAQSNGMIKNLFGY